MQQVESGCYNFCRFALLEPGQTSSSCRGGQQQQQVTGAAPHAKVQDEPAHEVGTVVDGFYLSAEAAMLASGGTSSHNQQPQTGLLSMQLKQQQQQDSICAQVSSLGLQEPLAPHAAAGTASAAEEDAAGDLTEAAEEQLMLRSTNSPAPCLLSTTTTQAGLGSNSTSSSSCNTSVLHAEAATAGPCYLALPCEDPAQLGISQLGVGGTSSSSSEQKPHILLTQPKGPQQAQRGQFMAVVLLQPQVSWAP